MFVVLIVILSQVTCTRLWRTSRRRFELDPKNGYAYFLRGQSYLRNGEKAKAEADFLRARGLGYRKVRRLRKGEDRRKSVRRTGDGVETTMTETRIVKLCLA